MPPSSEVGSVTSTMRSGVEMKVWFVMEVETYKDDAKRKKYYEYLNTFRSLYEKKHEGVEYEFLGGWSDNPGCVMYVYEYESVEEFSKVWSDEEYQQELVKLRNHCDALKIRVMRPTVRVPPK
jgi:hypothetical protein